MKTTELTIIDLFIQASNVNFDIIDFGFHRSELLVFMRSHIKTFSADDTKYIISYLSVENAYSVYNLESNNLRVAAEYRHKELTGLFFNNK